MMRASVRRISGESAFFNNALEHPLAMQNRKRMQNLQKDSAFLFLFAFNSAESFCIFI